MKKIQTLNIGSSSVQLAEYELGGKGSIKLVNYGVAKLAAPLDSGNASAILSPAILEIVREKGIRPGDIAVSLPGQMVFPKFAAIPFAGGQEKFDSMVKMEIEQNIPFPIDEMVCDTQVLGDTESGDKSVMIIASKLDQVEPITSAISACGFSPILVDAAPLAVSNSLHFNTMGSDDCSVILDIGAKTTSLIIVEGDKLYNRSVPVAGNNITREIAQVLGVDQATAETLKITKGYVAAGGVEENEDPEADAISKSARSVLTRLNAEVSRSINFYRGQQGGGTPTKLYITGGTALLPQIAEFFSESLGIEVEFLNPFDRITTGSSVDAASLESDIACLAASAGLAIHVANESRYTINLLPPAIIAERKEKARIPYVIASAVLFVAAAVCCYVGVLHRGSSLSAELEAVETRATALKNIEAKIQKAKDKEAAATKKADELKSYMLRRGEGVVRTNAIRNSLGDAFWIDSFVNNRATVRGWKDKVDKAVTNHNEKNGVKRTAPEIVATRFASATAVDPENIKITDMTKLGKNGEVEQFVLEHYFKPTEPNKK